MRSAAIQDGSEEVVMDEVGDSLPVEGNGGSDDEGDCDIIPDLWWDARPPRRLPA